MRKTTWATLMGMGLAAATMTLTGERSANACGGCFGPPGPSTQVSAHRMAFAVSAKRTILWDQIQYVGAPSSFGWVLPIKSAVDVGVSSDELFQRLESTTQPVVTAPPPPACPPPEKRCRTTCYGGYDGASPGGFADGGTASDTGSSGVEVWGTTVVGPYEATQLSATDSTALRTWLTEHDYNLPDAIVPVVDAYITEGFGFLAIKLVPTAGTSRMVPIRIAFDGASPILPLRMVAAGTGENVGIKLFLLGEGRWEAKNFDTAEIKTEDLVWNFSAMGSNLGTLENDLITKYAGKVWITESSDDYATSRFFSGLPAGTTTTPGGTVFSDATDQTEIDKAFPGRANITVSRLFAQLPVSALGNDLQMQASLGGKIPAVRQAPKSINWFCPTYVEEYCPGITPICEGSPGTPGYPATPGTPYGPGGTIAKSDGSSGNAFGCTTTSSSRMNSLGPWIGLGLAGLVAGAISRRRRGGR
ncbi:MAG: DUF2330 domain-containing protein [Polyangiales bacterium]